MRTLLGIFCSLALSGSAAVGALPPLPEPVTNNAVAAVGVQDGTHLFTFGGLLAGKTWRDTTARAWTLLPGADAWVELPPVPEGEGRLASVAVAVGGRAFIFGGYTVAEDGDEASLPYVHSIAPGEDAYTRHADMPVPVDDAVALPYMDRYVYVVSGWHDLGNVNLVQLYDTQTDTWVQATPWPGEPVFGHAGGIVGNTMVICDGVAIRAADSSRPRRCETIRQCAAGVVDEQDPRRVSWRMLTPHPGVARYRMAATGYGDEVWFLGGSATAYNYDGTGYDGTPAEPAEHGFAFDTANGGWRSVRTPGIATMDHRGMVRSGEDLVIIGGMRAGQAVTPEVLIVPTGRHPQ